MRLGAWLDRWHAGHRREGTTKAGYETKIRLHIKPHIGNLKLKEITDDILNELYRKLEQQPCPSNNGEPLGPKSVRHIHNILSAALGAAVPKLIPINPCATAKPPTERQIKAKEQRYPTLNDSQTADVLRAIWQPCGMRACDKGETHHCLRDAALWTVLAVTGLRRSEALGLHWEAIQWDNSAIELSWVVGEEGNSYHLRRLTKDGDAAAVIYVDPALMAVLRWQRDRVEAEKRRLGDDWTDHGLVFPRDGFRLRRDGAGGPQDPEKVSARWRSLRDRLSLPESIRLHDLRSSYVTNALDAKENPVEISANARHHSPGYTMTRYGKRREEGARKLAASSAGRIGLARLA
ncbi:tyrosine-type recombinase/integrase [Streptomyces radicis]|nr:tyrosine-type recombinase/integrase [Streptomyces radicis]